jgi:hypothetical protein
MIELPEVKCAECDGPIDLDTEDEDLRPEMDLELVVYRSGASEMLQMIYHTACNISRIQKLDEIEEQERLEREEPEAEQVEPWMWREES